MKLDNRYTVRDCLCSLICMHGYGSLAKSCLSALFAIYLYIARLVGTHGDGIYLYIAVPNHMMTDLVAIAEITTDRDVKLPLRQELCLQCSIESDKT